MNPPPPLPLALTSSQVILAVLFVAGGLIKHFLERRGGSPDAGRPAQRTPPLVPPRPTTAAPRPAVPTSPEGEFARRLLEALGRPGDSDAPGPAPVVPRPLPPLPLPPPVPPRLQPPLPPAPPVRPARETPSPQPSARRVRHDPAAAPASGGASRPDYASSLRSPSATAPALSSSLRGLVRGASRRELRRAILLREVLGPPRALSESGDARY